MSTPYDTMPLAELSKILSEVSAAYDYAVSQYAPPPPPGKNPAMVRDDQIRAAIRAVLSPAG